MPSDVYDIYDTQKTN